MRCVDCASRALVWTIVRNGVVGLSRSCVPRRAIATTQYNADGTRVESDGLTADGSAGAASGRRGTAASRKAAKDKTRAMAAVLSGQGGARGFLDTMNSATSAQAAQQKESARNRAELTKFRYVMMKHTAMSSLQAVAQQIQNELALIVADIATEDVSLLEYACVLCCVWCRAGRACGGIVWRDRVDGSCVCSAVTRSPVRALLARSFGTILTWYPTPPHISPVFAGR